jgi:hypothetical protein
MRRYPYPHATPAVGDLHLGRKLVLDGSENPSYNWMDACNRGLWEEPARIIRRRTPSPVRCTSSGGTVQATAPVQGLIDPARLRANGVDVFGSTTATRTAQAATFVSRGPLASSAHRLLGLGAVGSARLGQAQGALARAFGGDVEHWQQLGTPWIAARSLARPTDSGPSQSASAWLLAGAPGQRSGSRL